MKIVKNKNLKFLLIGIIIILIFFLCTIDSKAQKQVFKPISYDFESNVLLNKDGSFEPNMYNIREQSEYLGNYESAYSFEQDVIGSEPDDWIISNDDDCSTKVISSINGHSKVLQLYDNNDNGRCRVDKIITQGLDTIFEFWIGKDKIIDDSTLYIKLFDGMTECVYLYFFGNDLYCYYIEPVLIKSNFIEIDILYHIKLVLHDDDNEFDCYINNILAGNDFSYLENSIAGMDKIVIQTDTVNVSYKGYIDAIDYSLDYGYYENRNLIPKKEYTNRYEVDKYEFDYDSLTFESDLCSWTQNEYDSTTNDVHVNVSYERHKDKQILIDTPSQTNTYENGIEFNDNSNSQIVDITARILFNTIDEWCATIFYIFPQSIDLDYPIGLKFNGADEKIDLYDISSKSYVEIGSFVSSYFYDINIYLNYYDDIMIVSIGYIEVIFPLDNGVEWNDLYGLDKIQINNSMSSMGNLCELIVYNVGIYENGKYFQSNIDDYEFGLMYYEIDDTWNSDIYNLLTVYSKNDYRLFVWYDYDYFLSGHNIRERSIQIKKERKNLQDWYNTNEPKFTYDDSFLLFMLFDNFSIPYEVKIEGILLTDNKGVSSHGIHIYDNSYPNKYWFYCIDNKLYYNFSNSYKLGIETMTIVFDVIDVLLDKSFLFAYNGYIDSISAKFDFNYNGLITLESYEYYESFDIPNDIKPINSVYNISLEQQFTLTEIRIHIKTDELDLANGYTSGYIQNLNLYYDVPLTPDYDPISILELDFLEAMIFIVIRLIFFLIPSLIFRTKFGNKSILPMWLLIGLILFISGLIPFWLFFIQIIAIGSMLMLNRSKEVD